MRASLPHKRPGPGGRRRANGVSRRRRGTRQIHAGAILSERLPVGRRQILFVDGHLLEQVEGGVRAVIAQGVVGQAQLLRGGASRVKGGAIVGEQTCEFSLFGG